MPNYSLKAAGAALKLPNLFETAEEMMGLLSRVLITTEQENEPLLENPETALQKLRKIM